MLESKLVAESAFGESPTSIIVVERAGRIDTRRLALERLGFQADFLTDATALAKRLAADWSIEVVLLDLALATPDLLRQLIGMGMSQSGPAVIAIADAASADVAGVALSSNIAAFIDADAGDNELEAALHAALRDDSYAVADRGDFSLTSIGALSREVERIATALASLAQEELEPPAAESLRAIAGRVRAMIKSRRIRERFFPTELFSDPAWDMMLDLTAARLDDRLVSVSSLCIAAAVPTTTALRWIRNLCDAGMFERRVDPDDARRAFIVLSDPTYDAMLAYMAATASVFQPR